MAETIKLYSLVGRDRSARVAWLLDELGLDWERVWLDAAAREHKGEAFLKRNPFGKVPALDIDGRTMFESGAIIAHLIETHPDSGLAPATADAAARAEFWQWLFWGCSTLEVAVFELFKLADPSADTPERRIVLESLDLQLAPLNAHLDAQPYLRGDAFSAADIAACYPLGLLNRRVALSDYPAIEAYLARLYERPAAVSFVAAMKEA